MKLRSGRKYKHDLSDIVGILAEHEKQGIPIKMEMIDRAVNDLYDGWEEFPSDSKNLIEEMLKNDNYQELYASISNREKQLKGELINFEKAYPNVLKESNLDDIIKHLKTRK